MSFSVSSLTDYVREIEGKMVTSIVIEPKTAQIIASTSGNIQTGIKSTEKINIIDTDAVFQAGGSCGFSASGTTSITQRTITVGKIKVHESLCPKTLEAKYTQKALQAGSQYDTVAFAQEYLAKKNARIAAQLETAIWQGDTASGTANLARFDGFIKLIGAGGGTVVNANSTTYYGTALTGGFTSGTIVNAVNAVYKGLPPETLGKEDVRVFMGWDTLRLYGVALTEGKYFNPAFNDGQAVGEIFIPNTGVKIVAVNGLNGTSKMYAMPVSNMFIGTDLLNEEDKYDLFFAKEADEVRFMAEWKYGVQFAFPEQIVKFDAA
jgi:hypothetical protein